MIVSTLLCYMYVYDKNGLFFKEMGITAGATLLRSVTSFPAINKQSMEHAHRGVWEVGARLPTESYGNTASSFTLCSGQ